MASLITCGKINKNIVYPLLGGLSKLIAELMIYKEGYNIDKHPLILGVAAGFGMSLSIIPYIFLMKFSRRTKREEKPIIKERLELIYNDINIDLFQQKRKKKFLFIFLSSLLDFIQKTFSFLFIRKIIKNFWLFDIFFLSLFSYLLLQAKLYNYHYYTLIIMIFLGIVINILDLYDDWDWETIIYILLALIVEIIYSVVVVINKYNMDITFSSPYEISFFEGLFSLIANCILLIIFSNIDIPQLYPDSDDSNIESNGKYYLDNFYIYYEKLDYKEIIIFITFLFSRLLFNLFGLITVKNDTPSHIVILLIIGEIGCILKEKEDKSWKSIIKIISIIIIIFMILVFTEIIELNFWGLQTNTKKNIEDRAANDNIFNYMNDDDTESNADISKEDIELPS